MKYLLAAVASIALVAPSAAAAEGPVLNPDWAERLVHVDGLMRHSVNAGEAVGAETLAIKDGEVLIHRAYGVEDADTGELLAPGAIWSVKSMTKPLVALAVLMLVEDGAVSLHEPIATWLPNFAGDRRVTVSHLLSHKSGVAGLAEPGSARGHKTFREWVEAWAELPPAGPMGEYRYSDFNFAVAALIIAERSGTSAEAFIARRILSPLGMTNSYLTYDPSFDSASRVPSRYVKRDGGYTEVWDQRQPIWYPFFPGGWGLWSSAEDYAKFMQFWLDRGVVAGRQLINPALIDLALTPHTRQVEGDWTYGLGWFLHGTNETRTRPAAFSHGGFDGTRGYAYPADGTIALILTHSRGSDLLEEAEGELLAVEGLGAKSPTISLLADLDWAPLEADQTAAAWTGRYEGTAHMEAGDYPIEMTIAREGKAFRWVATIDTPSGVSERSALFVAESKNRGWLASGWDGTAHQIRRDRRLMLMRAADLFFRMANEYSPKQSSSLSQRQRILNCPLSTHCEHWSS